MDHVPRELLADIFRRLPPRSLAACRSVRNDWCAVVDAGRMLLPFEHLVPRPLRGVFINYNGQDLHEFFSRAEPIAATTSPAAAAASSIDAALEFMDVQEGNCRPKTILDHRNGLVLCQFRYDDVVVCNPATRRSAPLPYRRCSHHSDMYLVFDPTVSLHYDVVSFPDAPDPVRYPPQQEVKVVCSIEWPPPWCTVQVFSSKTGRWENRRFARGGNPAVVRVSGVWSDPLGPRSKCVGIGVHSVYWRGTLYLHYRGGFVIRLSLQGEKYQVTRTPKSDTISWRARSFDMHEEDNIKPCEYLGKSKEGVYFTAVYRNQLLVWVLRDHQVPLKFTTIRTLKWELKYSTDLQPSFLRHYIHLQTSGEEIIGSWLSNRGDDDGRRISHERWESDNDNDDDDDNDDDGDNVVADQVGEGSEQRLEKGRMHMGLDLLGFHPHKEIAFLRKGPDGFAYRFGSSRLQYLGSLGGTSSAKAHVGLFINSSFVYTPCFADMLRSGVNVQEEEEEAEED